MCMTLKPAERSWQLAKSSCHPCVLTCAHRRRTTGPAHLHRHHVVVSVRHHVVHLKCGTIVTSEVKHTLQPAQWGGAYVLVSVDGQLTSAHTTWQAS